MAIKLDRKVIILLSTMYTYVRAMGIIPYSLNKSSARLELSRKLTLYSSILNGVILVMMPFCIVSVCRNFPIQLHAAFTAVLYTQCILLYVISAATFIVRFATQHRFLQIFNANIALVEMVHPEGFPSHRFSLLHKLIFIKAILPVNQLITGFILISENIDGSLWSNFSNCLLIFSYSQLFVIVNTWCVGAIAFRLVFDTINSRLSMTIASLERKSIKDARKNHFSTGLILYDKCQVSATIDNLATLHSFLCAVIYETIQILQYLLVLIITFLFINNIVGLFQLYYILKVAIVEQNFRIAIAFAMTIGWNLVDIFVLFYISSLVNAGSMRNSWKYLYAQFNTSYSNVYLDKSVSGLFCFLFASCTSIFFTHL